MNFNIIMQLLASGLMIGSIYALIGLSFSFLYRGTGRINWAQGSFVTMGAMVAWTIVGVWGLSYWFTPLAGALTLAIIALIVYSTIINWISRRGGGLVDVLLVTIGLAVFLDNLMSVIWGTEMFSVRSPVKGVLNLSGVLISKQSIVILGISLLTTLLLYIFLQRTSFGTAMRATADNRYAASVVGINTKLTDMSTWAISAAAAGIAGAAIAPLTGAHFYMGVILGLKGFAAAVIGGYGNVWGALVGGILIGLIETLGVFILPSQWKDALTFTVLIGFLLFRPHGIFGAEAFDD